MRLINCTFILQIYGLVILESLICLYGCFVTQAVFHPHVTKPVGEWTLDIGQGLFRSWIGLTWKISTIMTAAHLVFLELDWLDFEHNYDSCTYRQGMCCILPPSCMLLIDCLRLIEEMAFPSFLVLWLMAFTVASSRWLFSTFFCQYRNSRCQRCILVKEDV